MAHFAEIDKQNNVIRILVTDNNDPNGDEGHQWLQDNFGGTWIKTSYNTIGGVYYDSETREPAADQSKAFRKNYPDIGYTYDINRDAFIPPKPENGSWVLDEASCLWTPAE